MLRIEGLCKSYDSIKAMDNISLSITPQSLTVLAGADGAGKSTLLKMILGLVKKDEGEIYLDQKPIGSDFSKITSITGYMPERFSLYTDLSVEENMNFFSDIQQVPRRRREDLKQRLLEKTGMLPFKKRRASALSGGMKQKLALSTILLSSPDIIILDEPTTGVDPLSRIEFFNIIEDLKQEGKTIIVSTPYLDEAEKGDDIVFIKNGKIIKQGSLQSLKENFPAHLFRILPEGNIFEAIESIRADDKITDDVYIRGRYIKYMQGGTADFIDRIPAKEVKKVSPSLEDIYLYYERNIHAG